MDHWFSSARPGTDPERFEGYWQQMLDFCLSSEAWMAAEGRASYHLPSLWLSLLGFATWGIVHWKEHDGNLLVSKAPYFQRIVPKVLPYPSDAARFISWLSEPAAAPIRVEMLDLVHAAAHGANEHWWREQRLAKAISRYLNVLWHHNRHEILFESARNKRFQEVLHLVAGLHEPLALELQGEMGSQR